MILYTRFKDIGWPACRTIKSNLIEFQACVRPVTRSRVRSADISVAEYFGHIADELVHQRVRPNSISRQIIH